MRAIYTEALPGGDLRAIDVETNIRILDSGGAYATVIRDGEAVHAVDMYDYGTGARGHAFDEEALANLLIHVIESGVLDG